MCFAISGLNNGKRAFLALLERFPYEVDQLRFHERVCVQECDGAWGERHCFQVAACIRGPECRFGSICTRHHLSLNYKGSRGTGRVEVHNYKLGFVGTEKNWFNFSWKKVVVWPKKKHHLFFSSQKKIKKEPYFFQVFARNKKKESYFFQFLKRIRVLNFYKEKMQQLFFSFTA